MDAIPNTPKRKRRNPSSILRPTLQTGLISPTRSPNSSEPNSPRTAVVNKFSNLQLDTAVDEIKALPVQWPKLKKRLRFSTQIEEAESSEEDSDLDIIVTDALSIHTPRAEYLPMPITAFPHQASPPTLQINNTTPSTVNSTLPIISPPTTTLSLPPRLQPSHASTKNLTEFLPQTTFSIPATTTAIPTTYADLPSDDDGRGINGIGYRPTPAMAYARAQKRKQQVLEWRAREAKEARQKRRERRVDEGEEVRNRLGVEETGRVVRFA